MDRQPEDHASLEAALAAEREARQAFVSLVTHELRIPMTAIKGYADLLLKGIVGPINETQASFLKTIQSNVERMSGLVSDLSDINKLDSQRLVLDCEAVSPAVAIEEALEMLAATRQAKVQTLHNMVPKTVPPVWADRTRLVQVLHTLLKNATQYTPEGGVITIIADIDPVDTAHLRITVQDTGIGILAEAQAHIFEMFYRAPDAQTRETPGNGLSLHLAQRLVALNQGRLTFESKRDHGSSFYLTLPIVTS